MLLGALFLGIGGQASNVREVQTLSMPVTMRRSMLFRLASLVVGDIGGTATWIAALFPFSSPLAMVARAAQERASGRTCSPWSGRCLWVASDHPAGGGDVPPNVLKSGPRIRRKPWLFSRRT